MRHVHFCSAKRSIVAACVLGTVAGCFLIRPVHADPVAGPVTTSITTNPMALLSGRLNIEVERAVSENISVYGGINFILLEPVIDINNEPGQLFGVGPEVGLRLYLIGDAPEGLYIGAYADFAYLNHDGTSDFGYALGGAGGFNWILFDRLVLALGALLGYQNMLVDRTGDDMPDEVGMKGVDLRLRLGIGVAF